MILFPSALFVIVRLLNVVTLFSGAGPGVAVTVKVLTFYSVEGRSVVVITSNVLRAVVAGERVVL